MLDTKGPEIRTGFLQDHASINLEKDQELILSTQTPPLLYTYISIQKNEFFLPITKSFPYPLFYFTYNPKIYKKLIFFDYLHPKSVTSYKKLILSTQTKNPPPHLYTYISIPKNVLVRSITKSYPLLLYL